MPNENEMDSIFGVRSDFFIFQSPLKNQCICKNVAPRKGSIYTKYRNFSVALEKWKSCIRHHKCMPNENYEDNKSFESVV